MTYHEGGIVSTGNPSQSCGMRLIGLALLFTFTVAFSSCGGSSTDSADSGTDDVSAADPVGDAGLDADTVADDAAGDDSDADAESSGGDANETAAMLPPTLVIPVVRTDGTAAAFDTVVLSPSGDRVALLTGRGVGAEKLEIFDTTTGESVGVIADAGAMNMGWNDDGLIVASDQGVLTTWDPTALTATSDPDAQISFECPQEAQFDQQSNTFFSTGGGFACRVDVGTGALLTAALPDADLGRVNGATFPRPGGAEVIVEYNIDGGGVIRATLDGTTLAILDSETQDRYQVHAVGTDTVLTVGGGLALLEPVGVEVPGVNAFTGSSAGSYFLHNIDFGTIYDANSGDAVATVSYGTSRSWSAGDTTLAVLSEAGIEIYDVP